MAARFYFPQLDGLRFFAFFGVFVFHATEHLPLTDPWVRGARDAGSSGVDLFFVLSSFLITSLLIRETTSTGRVHIRAFWMRRLLRIWPLYFVFVALLSWAEALPTGYVLALATFTVNLTICCGTGWVSSITAPLWSVAGEEQFYLIWPGTLRWLPLSALPWLCLGLIALGLSTRLLLGMPPRIWTHPLARIDPFAWGALLAWAWSRRSWQLPAWAVPVALGVALAGVVACHALASTEAWRWVYIGMTAGMAGALGICLAAPAGWLGQPALVYLGRISYGLYVWHALGVAVANRVDWRWYGRWPMAAAITLALAALTYHALERPVLRLKDRFTYVRSAPI